MNSLARIWRALIVPAVAISLPVGIATVVVFRFTGGGDFLQLVVDNPQAVQSLPPEVFVELARPFYLALGIATLFLILGSVFVALASHRAVSADIGGDRASGRTISLQALSRYPTGVFATLIAVVSVGILLALGITLWLVPIVSVGTPNQASEFIALALLVALVGPGIWVGVSVSMTTAAVAIEGLGALSSIRRSMRLVRGRWWPTAGYVTLVGLVGGIAIQLIQLVAIPLTAVGGGSVTLTVVSAIGVLAQGILVAAIAAIYTHWYIDLRARKETLSTSDLA